MPVATSVQPPARVASNERRRLLALNDVDLVATLFEEVTLLFRRDIETSVRILRGEERSTAHERQQVREMVAGIAADLRNTVREVSDEGVLAMKQR